MPIQLKVLAFNWVGQPIFSG